MLIINLDEKIENADWLRSLAWDLPVNKDDARAIAAYLGGNLKKFLSLPAAEALSDSVRAQLEYMARGAS